MCVCVCVSACDSERGNKFKKRVEVAQKGAWLYPRDQRQ